jgi:hypothetical protein
MLVMMDQNNTGAPSSATSRHGNLIVIIACCIVCLFISILVGFIGYQTGLGQGKQLAIAPTVVTPMPKKEITSKPASVANGNSSGQESTYNVFYTPPAGWGSMIWHPDPNSVGTALFSPDYTSIDDPNPKTGFSVLIYQVPGQYKSMDQLRPAVEETEEALQRLTQTTIAGYPAYQSIYNDTDSGRYLEDYDILKGSDRWLIRIDFPGTSYNVMQEEEQQYNSQINQLLQSIQFKTIQYQ